MDKTAGVVLAGGQSSRMGENKALMVYQGRPLVEHMMDLLQQAGCGDVYISGDVPGYDGIPDTKRYAGPAGPIISLLKDFHARYDRVLFVPVDMPLISPGALEHLLSYAGSSYYKDYPLPACLMTGPLDFADSVRGTLILTGANAINLPSEWEGFMANINTYKEWKELGL